MNDSRRKSLSDIIGTAGSMLLFLLFAACMLIIIAAASSTYSRISSGFSETFNSSAAVRYISNKIRSADSCEITENGRTLVIHSGNILCVIGCGDNALYEKNLPENTDISDMDITSGDKIFNIADLEISEENGLYRITAFSDGESYTTMLRKG